MGTQEPASLSVALTGRPGISTGLLEVEQRLARWRRRFLAQQASLYPDPDPARLTTMIGAGKTLVTLIDPLPASPLIASAAREMLAAVRDLLPGVEGLQSWLLSVDSVADGASVYSVWFTAAWRVDRPVVEELAGKAGLDGDVILWAGRQVARPFFDRLGAMLAGDPALESRDARTLGCPCCGGAPLMSRYAAEESRRTLWCGLCDLAWHYPRLVCAFCRNADQEKLGYLAVEAETHYRIDVCEVCRGYLRVLDDRQRPMAAARDFSIEALATVHLQVLAETKHYLPGIITSQATRRPASLSCYTESSGSMSVDL